jgi:photosystem II stability/assembly factor-like uncharacterized protein
MVTNKFGTASDWADGDVLSAADLGDTFHNIRFLDLVYVGSTNPTTGVIAHDSTHWSAIDSNGTIYVTTDGGSSWAVTGGTAALDTDSFIRVCAANKAKAIAIEATGDFETAMTSTGTSTVTWNAATAATFGTQIYDVSYTTDGLIVVGGDDSLGTDHIIYSTDDGATWNNATTSPSAAVYAVNMFDATTGYAVDSAGNIWKTTNGADIWVDTGDNIVGTVGTAASVLCLSATTCIISCESQIMLYNNSTNTVTVVLQAFSAINTTGIVKTNSGEIYITRIHIGGEIGVEIYKSSDSGASWQYKSILHNVVGGSFDNTEKCSLTEYSNDRMLLSILKRDIIKLKAT